VVNRIVAKQMHRTSELLPIFAPLKSEFTRLQLLKFLCKFVYFPGRYQIKQKWVFFWNT